MEDFNEREDFLLGRALSEDAGTSGRIERPGVIISETSGLPITLRMLVLIYLDGWTRV